LLLDLSIGQRCLPLVLPDLLSEQRCLSDLLSRATDVGTSVAASFLGYLLVVGVADGCCVLKLRSLWGFYTCYPNFLCWGFTVLLVEGLLSCCPVHSYAISLFLWRVLSVAGIVVIYLEVYGIIVVSFGVYFIGKTVPQSTLTEIKP
jgi:hypothetical protein